MKFLVTGASGLLGLNLCLAAAEGTLRFKKREDTLECIGQVNTHALTGVPFPTIAMDLSQPEAASQLFEQVKPDAVIHCAAIANLDQCEKNPDLAYQVNAELPARLSKICALNGIRFLHISTDAIFDGQRGQYAETDTPHPINVYAETKLAGEQKVIDANPDAAIARVNFYGWSLSGKRSLAEFFYNKLSAGEQVNGFRDVFFCPLQVNDLADLLVEMAEMDLAGTFHVISPEALSKEEFGRRIARRFGFDENLVRSVSVSEGGLFTVRSPNLTMRSEKLEAALGHTLPGLDQGLERFYTQWKSGIVQKIRGFAA